ncbi:MAG: hypothetical protein CM15mP49_15720 [Actinomycetota bacterium]|nr:MAG: hypothetical protein CM15mP49_15720 [Actinomycetota bacterium]
MIAHHLIVHRLLTLPKVLRKVAQAKLLKKQRKKQKKKARKHLQKEAEAPIVQDQEESVLEPVFGGTLRWGLEAEVDGINPTASALSAPGLTMMNAAFDTLAAYDVDGNTVPHLAESFTSVQTANMVNETSRRYNLP